MTAAQKLDDIKNHPEKHRHYGLNELLRCCTVDNPTHIDLRLMDAHDGLLGPSRRCDVRSGPCSCGAWHEEV